MAKAATAGAEEVERGPVKNSSSRTLTPAMYLVFQALQWAWAIRLVEEAFFPSLLLSVVAGLLAYKRAQARQAWLERDEPDASR